MSPLNHALESHSSAELNPPIKAGGLSGRCLEMILDPRDPPPVNVSPVDGIGGKVARDGVGDKLNRHPIVFESMVELVGLRYRHPWIAGVGQNEGGSPYLRGVLDRRLIPIALIVVIQPGGASETVTGPNVHVGKVIPIKPVGNRGPGHRTVPPWEVGK